MSVSFFLVEGHVDVALVETILRSDGWSQVLDASRLTPELASLLPRYPYIGDLRRRVPAPLFLRKGDGWALIYCCDGNTEIGPKARTLLDGAVLARLDIAAMCVVVDADEDPKSALPNALQADLPLLVQRDLNEVVAYGTTWFLHVLPSTQDIGAVEHVLLQCADHTYSNVVSTIENAKDDILAHFNDNALRSIRKPFGQEKFLAAAIGAVLKPGYSLAPAVAQCEWVKEASGHSPYLDALSDVVLVAAARANS